MPTRPAFYLFDHRRIGFSQEEGMSLQTSIGHPLIKPDWKIDDRLLGVLLKFYHPTSGQSGLVTYSVGWYHLETPFHIFSWIGEGNPAPGDSTTPYQLKLRDEQDMWAFWWNKAQGSPYSFNSPEHFKAGTLEDNGQTFEIPWLRQLDGIGNPYWRKFIKDGFAPGDTTGHTIPPAIGTSTGDRYADFTMAYEIGEEADPWLTLNPVYNSYSDVLERVFLQTGMTEEALPNVYMMHYGGPGFGNPNSSVYESQINLTGYINWWGSVQSVALDSDGVPQALEYDPFYTNSYWSEYHKGLESLLLAPGDLATITSFMKRYKTIAVRPRSADIISPANNSTITENVLRTLPYYIEVNFDNHGSDNSLCMSRIYNDLSIDPPPILRGRARELLRDAGLLDALSTVLIEMEEERDRGESSYPEGIWPVSNYSPTNFAMADKNGIQTDENHTDYEVNWLINLKAATDPSAAASWFNGTCIRVPSSTGPGPGGTQGGMAEFMWPGPLWFYPDLNPIDFVQMAPTMATGHQMTPVGVYLVDPSHVEPNGAFGSISEFDGAALAASLQQWQDESFNENYIDPLARTFQELLDFETGYSETLVYKLEKRRIPEGMGEIPISALGNYPIVQTIYIPNSHNGKFRYIDTQVFYGQRYQYNVKAIKLVVGTGYTYGALSLSSEYTSGDSKALGNALGLYEAKSSLDAPAQNMNWEGYLPPTRDSGPKQAHEGLSILRSPEAKDLKCVLNRDILGEQGYYTLSSVAGEGIGISGFAVRSNYQSLAKDRLGIKLIAGDGIDSNRDGGAMAADNTVSVTTEEFVKCVLVEEPIEDQEPITAGCPGMSTDQGDCCGEDWLDHFASWYVKRLKYYSAKDAAGNVLGTSSTSCHKRANDPCSGGMPAPGSMGTQQRWIYGDCEYLTDISYPGGHGGAWPCSAASPSEHAGGACNDDDCFGTDREHNCWYPPEFESFMGADTVLATLFDGSGTQFTWKEIVTMLYYGRATMTAGGVATGGDIGKDRGRTILGKFEKSANYVPAGDEGIGLEWIQALSGEDNYQDLWETLYQGMSPAEAQEMAIQSHDTEFLSYLLQDFGKSRCNIPIEDLEAWKDEIMADGGVQ